MRFFCSGVLLLFCICLPVLAQRPEVYFIPLAEGPLSPLAKELAIRLQEELGKVDLSLIYGEEKLTRPVNLEFRSLLREKAKKQNLAFLLIQDVDPQELDTIRHDLYSTFDGRLLSSVLVKGDSGRSALLRPVLLAREIGLQLKSLPPVNIASQPTPAIPEDIPLLPPSLVTPGGTRPLIKGAIGGSSLSPLPTWGGLEVFWLEEIRNTSSGIGLSGGYLSGILQGSWATLPWYFFSGKIRGEWGWNPNSVINLSLGAGAGAGLLQLYPEGAPVKQKVLPVFDIRLSADLRLGRNFRLGILGDLNLISNPGLLLWIPGVGISAGWKI